MFACASNGLDMTLLIDICIGTKTQRGGYNLSFRLTKKFSEDLTLTVQEYDMLDGNWSTYCLRKGIYRKKFKLHDTKSDASVIKRKLSEHTFIQKSRTHSYFAEPMHKSYISKYAVWMKTQEKVNMWSLVPGQLCYKSSPERRW
jgi:hypothetical protein